MSEPRSSVLIIGCGSIGERHVRCFLRTGRAEVGICEPNAALLQRIGDTYGVADRFASLDEALSRRWDTAVVATPAPTHMPIAHRLVIAGVAPLIEKPLALELPGTSELLAAARDRGVVAGVAYVYRAHPALRAMRDAIVAGRFGRVAQVVVVAGQNFPTYRPAYRETYYARREAGGGAVQDALTHLVNAVEWLAGPTDSVVADVAHQVLEGVDVEDTVNVLARNGGALVSYSLNQHQAPNETTITVVGDRGTARFEVHQHRWGWMDRPETPWSHEPAGFTDRDEWFTAQESAWLDALAGETAPLCGLEAGVQTLRVNRAILESAATGQRVSVEQVR